MSLLLHSARRTRLTTFGLAPRAQTLSRHIHDLAHNPCFVCRPGTTDRASARHKRAWEQKASHEHLNAIPMQELGSSACGYASDRADVLPDPEAKRESQGAWTVVEGEP